MDVMQDAPEEHSLLRKAELAAGDMEDEEGAAEGEEGQMVHMQDNLLIDDELWDAAQAGEIGLHRNAPETLRERRTNILVAANPEDDDCLYMRLTPEERAERMEELLQSIRDNDDMLFVAKFFNLGLGPDGAVRLRSALRANTWLRKLYVTGNGLAAQGTKTLCKALVNHPSLTKIDLQCNRFGVEGAKYIAEALMNNNMLAEINVAGNDIMDAGCEAICNALLFNRKSRVAHLNIGNNKVTTGGFHLSKLLRQSRTLRILYCWRNRLGNKNRLGEASFSYIADALPYAKSLVLLDVTYNNIQPYDAERLKDILIDHEDKFDHSPRILKIIEGNLIPHPCIPILASFYALYRLPILDPEEEPLEKPAEMDEAKQYIKNITIDKEEVRAQGGHMQLEYTLNLEESDPELMPNPYATHTSASLEWRGLEGEAPGEMVADFTFKKDKPTKVHTSIGGEPVPHTRETLELAEAPTDV